MKNETALRDAIKTVAARFDIFDYPLTSFEIWQFLPLKSSYSEVRDCLKKEFTLESSNGFYFLPGRKEIIATRHLRFREAEKKINLARRRLILLSWLPWIRLIALANVIGAHNHKPNNDIDLFIITQKNRVWLVKFFASSILALSGLRPTSSVTKDRLCVSFLADDTALNLENCRIGSEDWYFSYWLAGLVIISAENGSYEQLLNANQWLKISLPNWRLEARPRRRFTTRRLKRDSQLFLNSLERLSRRFQEIIMAKPLREQKNKGVGVIITDHLLKLHTGDRRAELFKEAIRRAN